MYLLCNFSHVEFFFFLWYINIYLVHKTELMFYTHCKYNCYDLRLSTKQFPESYSTAAIMKRAVENN